MCQLQENNPTDPRLVKYKREHFLAVFDSLHVREEFRNISLEDFPHKQIGSSQKKRKTAYRLERRLRWGG